jgi:hypothetical protein
MWLNAARDQMTHWVLDFSPCDVSRRGEMAKPQRVGARRRATNGGCEAAGASCVRRRSVAARRGGADAVGKVLGAGLRRAGVVAGEPSRHGCSVNVLRIRGAISTLGAEGTHVAGRSFWKMHENAWKWPRDGLVPGPAGQWATHDLASQPRPYACGGGRSGSRASDRLGRAREECERAWAARKWKGTWASEQASQRGRKSGFGPGREGSWKAGPFSIYFLLYLLFFSILSTIPIEFLIKRMLHKITHSAK